MEATPRQIKYLIDLAADDGRNPETVRAWAESAGRLAVSVQIKLLLKKRNQVRV